MPKQWYYQVMGVTVGPISSGELKDRFVHGKIQPDTLVRLGTDGKWHTVDQIKGLMASPSSAPATTMPHRPEPVAAVPAPAAAAVVSNPPITSHATSVADQETSVDLGEALPHEYDFFRLVGFEQAIGPALHHVLCEYCGRHHQTMTNVTRRALAEFLGRKDLLEPQPQGGATAAEPAIAAETQPA